MEKPIRRVFRSRDPTYRGQHRFEHWGVDNQVYFITARVRLRFTAFAHPQAKAVFWDRFNHYTHLYGFEPWVTTLLNNHYHTCGLLHRGDSLNVMMQRIHGSVAKLVNDVLEQRDGLRWLPFWRECRGKEYFDGCIRDAQQFTRAYRYTLNQSVRHGICAEARQYAHTQVTLGLEEGLKAAQAGGWLMENRGYRRYMKDIRRGPL